MLISITNQCMEGCSHCQAEATPEGLHMPRDVWREVLAFVREVEPRGIVLSGGEPTRHPSILAILHDLAGLDCHTILATNGSYVERDEIRANLNFMLGTNENLHLQVTSDDRFYPNAARRSAMLAPYKPVERILEVAPHGRALINHPESKDTKRGPQCANAYLMAKQSGDFTAMLRQLEKHQKLCKPHIDYTGTLRPGEAEDCSVIGHVSLGPDILHARLASGSPCNKCGLLKNIQDPRVAMLLAQETTQ